MNEESEKSFEQDISDNLLALTDGNDTDGTPLTKNSIDNISNTLGEI